MSQTKSKICYVIMPFSSTASTTKEDWHNIYNKLFKPIIEKSTLRYECKRSELENGSFTRDIVLDLRDAYVVLADITDFNPNVMWELGVRHSLSKRTIMVSRIDFISKIPADIREYGVIPYDKDKITGYNEFEEQINVILQKIEKEPEKPDSPIFNFIKEENLILTSYGRKQIINKLIGLMTEIGENLWIANEIIEKRQPTGTGGITSFRYRFQAIEKLLVENYVNGGNDYIMLLQRVRGSVDATNYRLNLVSITGDVEYVKTMDTMIFNDAKDLKVDLTKLMSDTRDLYSSVKSNSLKDEEPNVIISKDLGEQFFKQ
ncbi:MAG TPA: hypothetical protein VFA69_06295 [Candidatus Nitrosotalea sp.]|nr:hypothetical protein [Candidatus Nitrosotalea sp.]